MRFATLGDAVAQGLQVLNDTSGSGIDAGVVREGATSDGVQTGVDVVSGWRAHGRGLKAASKSHAFCGKPINMGRVSLTPVAAKIAIGAVISNHDDKVRFVSLNATGESDHEVCNGQ